MTISQHYDILVENSRQKATISKLRNGEWKCEFSFRWYDDSNGKEFPRAIGFHTQEKAHEAGEAWARGDSYAEVSKRWKPVAVRSES